MILRNRPRSLFLIPLGLLVYLPGLNHAQSNRYEVGLRLRDFETAWEQQPDAKVRGRCLEPLKETTTDNCAGN